MAVLNIDIYARGHLREKPLGSTRAFLCDMLKSRNIPRTKPKLLNWIHY